MFKVLILIFFSLLIHPQLGFAMHIAEGILPFNWALFWWLCFLVILALSLKNLTSLLKEDSTKKVLFAFITALVFLLSMIPIPVPFAGTCSHPVGVGVGVFVLGLSGSIVAGFIVLLLQALLLAHGGLSSLGANAFAMAIMGSLSAYLIILIFKRTSFPLYLKAFLSGLLADWFTYATTALQLSLALKGDEPLLGLYLKVILAFIPTQLPLGILEGVITASLVTAMAKRRRDLLLPKALNF